VTHRLHRSPRRVVRPPGRTVDHGLQPL